MISIREVSPRFYAGELVSLQMMCLEGDKPLVPTEAGRWWGVFDNDKMKIVGFACMKDTKNWPEAAYMARCGVVSKYRGKGLQYKLLMARLKAAKKEGKKFAVSDCIHQNVQSGNNLIKTGFHMYEPREAWALDNSIYWMKKL